MTMLRKKIFFVIFILLFSAYATGDVLWEQSWDAVGDFSSGTTSVLGLATAHTQATAWNASSYRVPISSESLISIGSVYGRSGKGVAYRFIGTDGPMGASIDVTFSDPDISWKSEVDTSGYDEIYYAYWLKTPVPVDWTTGGSPPAPWKGARVYVYNNTTYPWSHFYNNNYALSSHYFTNAGDATDYKYSFVFPSWASIYMYWYPQYNGPADGYNGTSTYPNQPYNNSTAYLFDSYLDDGDWHQIQYRVKLNTIGASDGLVDVYIDGNLIEDGGAGLELRTDADDKIMAIMLFDNYQKRSASGTQSLYIDDMVISTEFIGTDYVIGSTETAPTVNAGSDQNVSVNTATINGTATATTGRTIASVTCPGETVTPDDGAWDEQTEAWTCVLTGLAEGATTKTFTATDSAAETGTDSVVITYTSPSAPSSATVKGSSMKGAFYR